MGAAAATTTVMSIRNATAAATTVMSTRNAAAAATTVMSTRNAAAATIMTMNITMSMIMIKPIRRPSFWVRGCLRRV